MRSWSMCEPWKGSQSTPEGRAATQDWICSSPDQPRGFCHRIRFGRYDDQTDHGLRCRRLHHLRPDRRCLRGWAQMLPEYLGPPVGIANYANSGAASGDYGFWGDISSRWTKGDWIIIQFGHNDKTDSDATVEANLTPM